MSLPAAAGTNKVVIRYRDHRLLKGTTADFYPDKPEFHVHEGGEGGHPALTIRVSELKAVFFVRTYEGNPKHQPADTGTQVPGQGRKLEVTFQDGEVLRGFTFGYNPGRQGFFVVPSDPEDNNQRVFVVNAAVKKIAWVR